MKFAISIDPAWHRIVQRSMMDTPSVSANRQGDGLLFRWTNSHTQS